MTIAGVGRHLELRGLGARRILDLLRRRGVALAPRMAAPAIAESPRSTPRRSQLVCCIVSSCYLSLTMGLTPGSHPWVPFATAISGARIVLGRPQFAQTLKFQHPNRGSINFRLRPISGPLATRAGTVDSRCRITIWVAKSPSAREAKSSPIPVLLMYRSRNVNCREECHVQPQDFSVTCRRQHGRTSIGFRPAGVPKSRALCKRRAPTSRITTWMSQARS